MAGPGEPAPRAGRWQAFLNLLPVRAWRRYTQVHGGTLAGGVAYFGFFALFPAVGVGATATGLVLRNRPDLKQRLAQSVNDALSTRLIKVGDGEGLLDLTDLTDRVLLTTAVVAVAGLLFAGLGWLGAVRDGVTSVFGSRPAPVNPVWRVLKDIVLLATLGAAVLASVVAGVAVTAISERTADLLGLDGSGVATTALRFGGAAALVLVDIALLLVFMRLLSADRVPVRDLVGGAVAGGLAIGVLRLAGGLLLARASSNHALTAVSSVVIGLLVWFNLLARVSLLATAISATVATDRGHLAPLPDLAPATARPPAALSARRPPPGQDRPHPVVVPSPPPSFGARSQDRVALAAGAVLGAGTLVAGRVVARGGRAAVDLVTGRRRRDPDPD